MSLGQEILSNTYHAQLLEPWPQHNPHILSPIKKKYLAIVNQKDSKHLYRETPGNLCL